MKEQPTVLPWHREAGKAISLSVNRDFHEFANSAEIAAIIARHDPHAETLRLLEELAATAKTAYRYSNDTRCTAHICSIMGQCDRLRAHLAAQGGAQ